MTPEPKLRTLEDLDYIEAAEAKIGRKENRIVRYYFEDELRQAAQEWVDYFDKCYCEARNRAEDFDAVAYHRCEQMFRYFFNLK